MADLEEPSKDENDEDKQDKTTIKKAIDYLAGEEDLEEKLESKSKPKEDEFPGFFDFIIMKIWDRDKELKESDEEPPKGFFTKVKSLYSSYQKAKDEEVEKLQLYESISLGARLDKEFLVLLIGSCLIATFGLFQDSSAVIIGAMLIAPLMMPILGFSLGIIWGDKKLLKRSVWTLLIGSVFVLMISVGLTLAIPGVVFNDQINARIHPNLYDILIALASGFVGAYAYANPKISSSISGVAISVALMPPICAVGISLGLNDFQAVIGSFLLYLTNLVSIALAASLVFWRLRIHPVTEGKDEVKGRAKRKVVLASILLVMIAVPLSYFMKETYFLKERQAKIRTMLTQSVQHSTILDLNIEKYHDSYRVKAIVVIPQKTDKTRIARLKSDITALFDMKVQIEMIFLGQAHMD
ncbi:MAG TPA: TIGR00341 family protein [Spirochaetes bacterium]|nr:TIGR00341 family protein [Spirochaetota bacterium]